MSKEDRALTQRRRDAESDEPNAVDSAPQRLSVETPPDPLTMPELLAEQFPQGAPARVSGGMAAALQRELRRRNRKAEKKGY
jgi:hypothetical protein